MSNRTLETDVLVAGVDVGGTNIEVGLVDAAHDVQRRAKTATPAGGPQDVLGAITEMLTELGGDPVAVGVGIPGVVHGGEVLAVPNLPNWTEDFDLVGSLGEQLKSPVTLGNDVNVGLLGEWVAGCAQGARNVLGMWMGTGIGGSIIIDGRPYDGSRGAAGELGHVTVQPGGALCSCGRRGCLEAYAGRRSLSGVVTAMMDAGRHTSLLKIRDEEHKSKLTSKVWARALDEEDPVATELFAMAIEMSGVAIGSTLNLLDVELVVLGGGLAEKLGQDLADRIADAAMPRILRPNPQLRFAVSALGDDAGVVGAAALARASIITG